MDAVIQQMQVALGGGLTWLDHVFGKAERVEHNISELKQYYQKHMHEEPFYTPAVYVGGGPAPAAAAESGHRRKGAGGHHGAGVRPRPLQPVYPASCDPHP